MAKATYLVKMSPIRAVIIFEANNSCENLYKKNTTFENEMDKIENHSIYSVVYSW